MVDFQLSCLRSPKGNRWFLSTNYDSRETSSDESAKNNMNHIDVCCSWETVSFVSMIDAWSIQKPLYSENSRKPECILSLPAICQVEFVKKTRSDFCHGHAVTWEKSLAISSRTLGFQRAQQDVGPLKHLLRPVVPQLQDRQGLTDAAKKTEME